MVTIVAIMIVVVIAPNTIAFTLLFIVTKSLFAVASQCLFNLILYFRVYSLEEIIFPETSRRCGVQWTGGPRSSEKVC